MIKRYKIKPYNSYYHYKQKKLMKKRVLVVCILLGVIIFTVIMATHYNAKGEPIFNTQGEEDIVFKQDKIAYHLYVPPTSVKGIYLSGRQANQIDKYINLAEETEINSFIIDVKNDKGYLTFDTENPKLIAMGCVPKKPAIEDIKLMMEKIYKAGIYPIARVVTFKDNVVGNKYPDRVVQDGDGRVFHTPGDGEMWLDPYNKENWDYILEICKEAERLGFKEIQFDYIRFHESMTTSNTNLPKEQSKVDIITGFIETMYKELKSYGLYVSADVFGAIITSKVDAAIVGQDYAELSKHLDYINPMIYPSHYAPGSFGIAYPDLNPYGIILGAMEASQDVIKTIPREDRKAQTRPWLQDFTASWVEPHQAYEKDQIRQQIQAVYDAGLTEWILWNGAGNYTKDGLSKE